MEPDPDSQIDQLEQERPTIDKPPLDFQSILIAKTLTQKI
jgi:hypothetical protein